MNIIKTISLRLQKIPKPIVGFIFKALGIFILWQIIYLTMLLPNRVIDKPLSLFTGNATAMVLQFFSTQKFTIREIRQSEEIEGVTLTYSKVTIYKGDKRLVGIADSCNGLSLFVLYIGFILVYPSNYRNKILFVVVGLFIIVIVNILRTAGLAYLFDSHPKIAPFAHHYLYKLITYAVIFLLWVKFVKIEQKTN